MTSATDVRHLPAGIPRAIAMLTLALAAAGAVRRDAIADVNAMVARAATPPVAVGQAIGIDGGSKDAAAPDDVPVDGASDFVPGPARTHSPELAS